jgi:hypothetical protein
MKPPNREKDALAVAQYMEQLKHPLREEIEAVRTIIRASSEKIGERIKWNAPSYYYLEDMVTFNPRAEKNVHLVFHHPAIVSIPSALLEGDYKDRRMCYFTSMSDIEQKKEELTRILRELIDAMDTQKSIN